MPLMWPSSRRNWRSAGDEPMTTKVMPALLEWITNKIEQAVAQAIAKALAPALTRIDVLEKRPGDFQGVWSPDSTYGKNDAVQFDGGFWVARQTTRERPGDGCTAWRLAVHRGKQGREGKPGPQGPPGRDALARVASGA
jgi:hypothetical protein